MMIYTKMYKNLHLTILQTEEEMENHQGYKYLVRDTFAHTAFRTQEGLDYWLRITGLKIGEQIGHLYHTYRLEGEYFTTSIMGIDTWTGEGLPMSEREIEIRNDLLNGAKNDLDINCAWLSNGNFTKGYIERTKDGNNIYYLNPNEKNRLVYPHFAIKC